jgi:hypothetical protein
MFDALLRMQLGPIVERLAEMESQLEDLYRRAESFCRIGVCQEVDAASNTCKVSHGELLTPAIRFFNPSAGASSCGWNGPDRMRRSLSCANWGRRPTRSPRPTGRSLATAGTKRNG